LNLLSPITMPEEVSLLSEAGADEFYAGLHDKKSAERLGPLYIGTNRSDYEFQNLLSYRELESTCAQAASLGKRVYLTMNVMYPDRLMSIVKDQILRSIDSGVSAIIIGDPSIANWMQENKLPVETHVSCDATTLDRFGLLFWSKLGAKRVVLPRQMSLSEISSIVLEARKLEIDLEVFVFSGNCLNLDGCCNFQHGNIWVNKRSVGKFIGGKFSKQMASILPANARRSIIKHVSPGLPCACGYSVKPKGGGQAAIKASLMMERFLADHSLWFACGVCALYDLGRIGIRHAKQIGRTEFTRKKVKDAGFLRRMMEIARTAPDRDTYIRLAQTRYEETYGEPCLPRQCLFAGYHRDGDILNFHRGR